MSAQVYSVPGQTEGKKEGLFRMEKHTLMNYLLHVGLTLTVMKVFIILFLLVRTENILAIFKRNH